MPLLSLSSLDSQRFGLRVYRADVAGHESKQIAAELLAEECDLAIIRLPAGASGLAAALSRFGFPVLHCDTLVIYEVDLSRSVVSVPTNPQLQFRIAAPFDVPALEALVADTFSGYRSHYSANPFLDPARVLEGYKEWCQGFLMRLDGIVWLATIDDCVVAFAACVEDAISKIGEGVLYGVDPRYAGVGIYGDLIRHTRNDFKSKGFRTMRVSTQVWNLAVQKVWAREGFTMASTKDTLHVNSMLHAGTVSYSQVLTFDAAHVEQFALLSGDSNPIHLNDDAAIAAGFPSRIVHGALCAAEISRILGTVSPGPGTVLSQLLLSFFKPLLIGHSYQMTVRVMENDSGGARRNVVVRIDNGDVACVIARADVFVKG